MIVVLALAAGLAIGLTPMDGGLLLGAARLPDRCGCTGAAALLLIHGAGREAAILR